MAAISPQLLANQLDLLRCPDTIIHTRRVELDKLKVVLQEEKPEMELRQKHLLLREPGL